MQERCAPWEGASRELLPNLLETRSAAASPGASSSAWPGSLLSPLLGRGSTCLRKLEVILTELKIGKEFVWALVLQWDKLRALSQ